MKKSFLSSLAFVFLVACNSGGSSGDKPAEGDTTANKTTMSNAGNTPPETPTNALSANPDYQKGLSLVAASNCLTCHKIDEKLVGPAYKEVAAKYANASDAVIETLAKKIIKGGNGVWGEVSMTPNTGVTEENAKAMVKYILLLK